MADIYEGVLTPEEQAILDTLRKKIASVAGVTRASNRLTLRFTGPGSREPPPRQPS